MENQTETIAAIATGMTESGISIIRVSGVEAFQVVNEIFVSNKCGDLKQAPGYSAHYGKIVEDGEVLDEVILLVMHAPHSYTGEDTVEIQCHGGVLVTRKILEAVLHHGARCALPGEFTKRAFLNSRIDLAEAEAVIDLIDAKNEYARKASVGQLQGKLSNNIKNIRNKILDAISFIEAALDDPEHISLEGYEEQLRALLSAYVTQLNKMISSFDDGKILSEGVKTVILGKPNAGKSSLMNLFAGEEKAIVTEIAGTTRDVLSEQVQIAGIGFQIVDTAGIRSTEDLVEKIGVERSLKQAEQADLILYVVDSSAPLDENDKKIINLISNKRFIIVYNKTDLEAKVSVEELMKLNPGAKIIGISAKNQVDFEKLTGCMVELFEQGTVQMNDEVVITNIRHKEALVQAVQSLKAVETSMEEGFGEDLWTIDLTDAYRSLGTIIGEEVDDDVINNIFEKFCMGK
jgi:tRNA modification GTPase